MKVYLFNESIVCPVCPHLISDHSLSVSLHLVFVVIWFHFVWLILSSPLGYISLLVLYFATSLMSSVSLFLISSHCVSHLFPPPLVALSINGMCFPLPFVALCPAYSLFIPLKVSALNLPGEFTSCFLSPAFWIQPCLPVFQI